MVSSRDPAFNFICKATLPKWAHTPGAEDSDLDGSRRGSHLDWLETRPGDEADPGQRGQSSRRTEHEAHLSSGLPPLEQRSFLLMPGVTSAPLTPRVYPGTADTGSTPHPGRILKAERAV